MAGEKDTIFSPARTKKIAGSYKDANSKVNYKEFAGRSHYIAGEKGWEEVAEYALDWVGKL